MSLRLRNGYWCIFVGDSPEITFDSLSAALKLFRNVLPEVQS